MLFGDNSDKNENGNSTYGATVNKASEKSLVTNNLIWLGEERGEFKRERLMNDNPHILGK